MQFLSLMPRLPKARSVLSPVLKLQVRNIMRIHDKLTSYNVALLRQKILVVINNKAFTRLNKQFYTLECLFWWVFYTLKAFFGPFSAWKDTQEQRGTLVAPELEGAWWVGGWFTAFGQSWRKFSLTRWWCFCLKDVVDVLYKKNLPVQKDFLVAFHCFLCFFQM